jgi:hypothetical protein
MNTKNTNPRTQGFAILYAILVSSLVLLIGVGLYEITAREIVLSSSASQSQVAFFAADTGIECALYWDLKATENGSVGSFATSSAGITLTASALPCAGTSNIVANAGTWPPTYGSNGAWVSGAWPAAAPASGSTYATTTFYINVDTITPSTYNNSPACAVVAVGKSLDAGGNQRTYITSDGYNTCDINNPRRVDRLLTVHY